MRLHLYAGLISVSLTYKLKTYLCHKRNDLGVHFRVRVAVSGIVEKRHDFLGTIEL